MSDLAYIVFCQNSTAVLNDEKQEEGGEDEVEKDEELGDLFCCRWW